MTRYPGGWDVGTKWTLNNFAFHVKTYTKYCNRQSEKLVATRITTAVGRLLNEIPKFRSMLLMMLYASSMQHIFDTEEQKKMKS